jgi:hypothetical protein
MNNPITLPTTPDSLKEAIRTAIEFYQGSPAKNENKLNEALARALHYANYDQLSPNLSKIKEDIKIHKVCWNNINNIEINDFYIDDAVLYDIVGYALIDRENQIFELYSSISEASGHEKELMIDNQKYLFSLDDIYLFSRCSTNKFVAASDAPEAFNKICEDILAAQKEYNVKYEAE